jgi:hypothetical protein
LNPDSKSLFIDYNNYSEVTSIIKAMAGKRRLGGAIFADRRYDHVFIYHNGASSYYAVRGFRGSLKV